MIILQGSAVVGSLTNICELGACDGFALVNSMVVLSVVAFVDELVVGG